MIGIGTLVGRQCALLPALASLLAGTTPARGDEFADAPARSGGQEIVGEPPQQRQRVEQSRNLVFKDQITPHWFRNSARFWYRNALRDGTSEFVLVDAERGTREEAFDHTKLASSLSRAVGTEYTGNRLPFDRLEFIDDTDATIIRIKAGDRSWKCSLASYECSPTEPAAEEPQGEDDDRADPQRERRGRPGRRQRESEDSDRSPDGKLTAFIKDANVFVRASEGGTEFQLSRDGKDGLAYGRLSWSPDSTALVGFRIEPGERKEVHLIESSPKGGGRARLQTRPYALPGDRFTTYELNLFDTRGVGVFADPSKRSDRSDRSDPSDPSREVGLAGDASDLSRSHRKPAVDRFSREWEQPRLRWSRDGHRFTYQQTDRGHQRFRLIEVDASTAAVRNIIDERSQTFIWTAHTENVDLDRVTWLEKSDELIYVSERDGWRHLYLIDAATGTVTSQITKGPWVVRAVDRIDEEARQIWFRASGRNERQDPYLVHHYRVNFDGTGLVALTEGDGTHTIQLSPDRRFLIDTFSRIDIPPVHELRRAADGSLICRLDEADISELKSGGWEAPEVVVAKGRDGTTDIWGVLWRPRDFDPQKKYPVIEQIYAGPQGSFVPKSFSASRRSAALTDLGFVVVQIDGMGTANRSKAFHDVCWKNLKDAGFPDRILWHQTVATSRAWYDITRVGIFGGSAGGQNAAGALLFHPEFYKVAVASCGCHDNRMDKASWNEQWMGYPVGSQYAECSNIDNAHRLRGKLLLIVGELDTNVPPESTLRFADALIRAGKDFDLVVVPGANHGDGGPYGTRRRHDFFVRHLLGKEPPDRNGSEAER